MAAEGGKGPRFDRVRRAVCVIDVVESVRLMQEHEDDVIDRWRRFMAVVRSDVLTKTSGRLVKSLGDGMLIEFRSVPEAVETTFAIHELIRTFNEGRSPSQAIGLRAGIHVADIVVEDIDVFGSGVNLASRLGTLGRPGAVVLSDEAYDELPPSLTIHVEDLGECWLKHYEHPVRAFLAERTPRTSPPPGGGTALREVLRLGKSVAVLPLTCRVGKADDVVIGDLVAEGVIAQLGSTSELLVLSRLSTASLRGTGLGIGDARELCGARYLLDGSYAVRGGSVLLTVELADTESTTVVWADRFRCDVAALLEHPSEPIDRIARGVHDAILAVEAMRAATQPLPNLESASLLFGGISLLHRASGTDFARAREALTELADRVPRHHASHAWLAQWHCLRVIRGRATFTGSDAQEARFRIEQALERDPGSSLSWALRALVVAWLDKDLSQAEAALERALGCNPNEPLAWLFTSTLRGWQDRGAEAAAAADRALALSRLHPLRYYFATLSAAGYLADGRHAQAIDLCTGSLRANRSHTPTHRVLTIALALSGRIDEARKVAADMLAQQPGYTIGRYLDAYPGGRTPQAVRYADALRAAGVPQ